MISTTALWGLLALAASPAHAQDCAAWGTINPGPDPDALYIGETYSFFVGGGVNCGDVETCEWWLDEPNAIGELVESFGSPVSYQAPDELDGCTPVSFQLFLLCDADEPSVDAINLTVQCTAEDKDELLDAPGATVSGGGCTEPSQLLVLLPLLVIPRRKRATRRGR